MAELRLLSSGDYKEWCSGWPSLSRPECRELSWAISGFQSPQLLILWLFLALPGGLLAFLCLAQSSHYSVLPGTMPDPCIGANVDSSSSYKSHSVCSSTCYNLPLRTTQSPFATVLPCWTGAVRSAWRSATTWQQMKHLTILLNYYSVVSYLPPLLFPF